MNTLLLCFFVGGFVLGCSFGCGVTLWGLMEIKLDEIEAIRRGDD
jgi:hypothetical protein